MPRTEIKHIGIIRALCGSRAYTYLREDLGAARYRQLGVGERLRDEKPYRICARCIRVLEDREHSSINDPRRVLREHRRKNRLTLAACAQKAGVSVSYLSDYERGTRKLFKPETLIRIADAYGYSRVVLLALTRAQMTEALNAAIAANGGQP